MMWKLLLLLVAVAVLAVEALAPSLAESRIEEQVHANARGAATVSADVDSFPLVSRLLLTETVGRVSIDLEEVGGLAVPLAELRFALEGVVVDRGSLLGGEVRVREIARGVVTAQISLSALADALGAPIEQALFERAQVRDGALVVAFAGRELSLALPFEYVPCAADGAVEDDRLVLRCEIRDVPPIVLAAAQEGLD